MERLAPSVRSVPVHFGQDLEIEEGVGKGRQVDLLLFRALQTR